MKGLAARTHTAELIEVFLDCPVPGLPAGPYLGHPGEGYLAYFDAGHASSGPTEAVNPLIETIRRIGHGYHRFDHYRLWLLLQYGIRYLTITTPWIRRRRSASGGRAPQTGHSQPAATNLVRSTRIKSGER